MNRPSLIRWFLTTVVVMACPHTEAAEITIRGVVRDSKGKVITNPTIVVYNQFGTPFKEVPIIGKDGSYTLKLNTDALNLSIRYEHTYSHLHFIEALSTQKGDDHVINPVLLDVNGPKSFELITEQISTYRAIFLREFGATPTKAKFKELRDRYLTPIGKMPDPRKKYREGDPQAETLAKMKPYQRKLIQYELEELERFYEAKWFGGK